MKAPHLLLADAVLFPEPQASEAWLQWRAAADLDRLDTPSFQMLPLLAGRLDAWIIDDPQRALILGIVRRAWSQRQVALHSVARALDILNRAGLDRVAVAGPLVWGALYWPEKAVRAVTSADLLLAPEALPRALGALSGAGWTHLDAPAPYANLQSPAGETVRLVTRALPFADLPFLRAPWPAFVPMELGPATAATPPAEYALVTVLAGYFDDGIDWRCDALMICRHAHIDWDRLLELIRWRSEARRRLRELHRNWPADIPAQALRPAWTTPLETILGALMRLYRSMRGA